jgi:hypothetical protein
MKNIWYVRFNNEVWFYSVEGNHYIPEGRFTERKARFAYPRHLYNWIELLCAE